MNNVTTTEKRGLYDEEELNCLIELVANEGELREIAAKALCKLLHSQPYVLEIHQHYANVLTSLHNSVLNFAYPMRRCAVQLLDQRTHYSIYLMKRSAAMCDIKG